jgi:hypothetical protein
MDWIFLGSMMPKLGLIFWFYMQSLEGRLYLAPNTLLNLKKGQYIWHFLVAFLAMYHTNVSPGDV